MKNEKAVTFLWSSLLAFAVSLGGTACLVTAFGMPVDLGVLALCSGIGAVFCSLCYCLPLGLLPISAMALTGGFLWQHGELKVSVESLLYCVSRQYNAKYGWGIIKLNYLTADEMELQLQLAVCAVALLTVMAITWAVCRKKTVLPGVLLGLIPFGACLLDPNTIPGTGWTYLFFLGLLLLLISHTARRQDSVQGNRLCTFAVLPLAVLLLILFAANPQDSYSGQQQAQQLSDAVITPIQELVNRITGTVSASESRSSTDLTTVGPQLETQAEMLQVTAPYTGTLYLRGSAMDTYTGTGWCESGMENDRLYWPTGDANLEIVGEVEITTRYAHQMLYTPYYVRSLSQTDISGGVKNEKKLTNYSYSCSLPRRAVVKGSWTEVLPEGIDDGSYIHLSSSTLEWAQDLLEQIPGADAYSVYDRANAIADYVRGSARYDLNTQKMPSYKTDFAKWFLDSSDTGYCVHFATATTVLLQAANIPARYVTGYMVSVQEGVTTEVTLGDAHAWVEYWQPGFGWTVLESTPADMSSSYTPQETEQSLPTAPKEETELTVNKAVLYTVLTVMGALLVAALPVQRTIRLHQRRRRCSRGTANQRALACWQEVACLARLMGREPDSKLFELAQKAKFSRHTLTEQELAGFDEYILQAHKELRRHNLFRRFWYRFILAIY